MKQIFLFILSALAIMSAFAQSDEERKRDWNSYGYGQYYVVKYQYSAPSILDYDVYEDNTWRGYESQWVSGDYVFLKTCEYYTNYVPVVGTEATLFPDPFIHDGVCLANTLVDVKIPVSDNFVIPSMPDINLFFVDLDFIIKQKNHLNSITIPNMIRGVYSSSGEKLYVDTLYVEGDYECMFNEKGHHTEGAKKIWYIDDYSGVSSSFEGKEPVLIAKTVMYGGEPIKNYIRRGKGVGFGSEETYLNYLVANQWGDQIESVELTDGSLLGIAGNAFKENKTLQRVNFNSNAGNIMIGTKAFYGCENLKTCDIGCGSTVSDDTESGNSHKYIFGGSAFAYCTKLDTFRCKNQHIVKDIGNYMFLGCGNLRYVGNWDDIETIGEGAFIGCDKLLINISSENLKKIGAYAFKGCTKLYNINSESLEEIGAYAFEGNTGISGHVSVPNAEVYSGAFRNCVNLESIDIGRTLFIDDAFKGCTALEYANVNEDKESVSSSYFLWEGIGKGCFEDCVNLKGISFNGSGYGKTLRWEEIRRIDTCAFKNCRSLECDVVTCSEPYKIDEYVGEDEMRVFDSAFVGSGIKNVSLSYVNAANAFDDCANLESATFWGPDEGRNTFELPDFRNCPKLKKIVVNGGGWDLEAQVTLKDEQTVKVIDNLDGLYLLGKPHIYVGDYPNYNFANTILYVPKGMKNVYRENALAPTFKDIVELTDEQVGIIKVTTDGAAGESDADAPVYDLSGQRVLKTVPGNVYVSKGRKFIAK